MDRRQLRSKNTQYISKYGISYDEFVSLANDQDNRCKICSKKRKLVLDHCHTHNHLRGLLCSQCNSALGLFGDSIDSLHAAIGYLSSDYIDRAKLSNINIHKKDIDDHIRWYNVVTSPEGTFYSCEQAARYYGVHSTTIRDWCGILRGTSKEGFSLQKVKKSLNQIKQQHNIMDI